MHALTALTLAFWVAGSPDSLDRRIRYEVEIPASVHEVWRGWTTERGVAEWFAPAARIELRVNGPYEMFFDPAEPQGKRGGEGCVVLAMQPLRMLSFTWSAPPHLPAARAQRTAVVVRFAVLGPSKTRVTLVHSGWGSGGEWDEAFDYFTGAWAQVLASLNYRFQVAPVDWSNIETLDFGPWLATVQATA